ncbi:unnamed protein product [Larinioides sclopetarius]|uniref:Uncharacterized protein n=1 Tax=Larinioides sclopetarius TaxID=280406 RepID=A0AAV2BS44_9ARAC
MVNAIEVRKVTQDVLLFVWFKHGALSAEPPRESGLIPEISGKFMTNLSVSIWIESFRTRFIWDEFFKNHFKRMTVSTKLFANYVAYACYILSDSVNANECVFDVLSIVSEFSLRCLEGNCKKYLNTAVDLFCTFFESELCSNFEYQGGWKKFDEYIRKQYNSIQSKSIISDHKLLPNLFEYFPQSLERSKRPDYVINGVVLKKKQKPYYVVNGTVLKNITREQVESHLKAVNFATSIRSKLEKLTENTFEELITDFEKTYRQEKNLHRYAYEEHPDGAKIKKVGWNLAGYHKKKRQEEQCSSQVARQYPVGMQSNGAQQSKDKKSSDGIKNQVKECSSQEVQQYPVGMQRNGAQQNKDKQSTGGAKNQVKESSAKEVQQYPVGMQRNGAQQNKDKQSTGGTKNQVKESSAKEVQQYPVVMQRNGAQQSKDKKSSGWTKIQLKGRSSQKVQQYPVGIQRNGAQQNKDKQSTGGTKNQVKESSSKEVQQYPVGMQGNGAQQNKEKKPSDEIKNQVKEYSSQEVQQYPVGMQRNGAQQNKEKKPSDEIKNQVKEYSSQEVQQYPVGMQRNGAQQNKDKQSTGGTKNQVKESSAKKVQQYSVGMQRNGAQQKKEKKPSDEIKNQVKECSSYEVTKPTSTIKSQGEQSPGEMESHGVQPEKDQESSIGTENQVKHPSLNVKEVAKIVSCSKVTEGKIVAARDALNQNLDSRNFKDRIIPVQAPHLNLRSTKIETVKKLLGEMSPVISNLSDLILTLCEKYGGQVPMDLQLNDNA